MKTLLVALEFPPAVGGVETYYGNIVKYWPEPLQVITNSENALISPFLPFFGWLRGLFNVNAQIQRDRPDWVLGGEILPIGTILYILSFFHRFDFGIFLHGLDFSLTRTSSWKRFLTKRILTKAQIIICANRYTLEEVKKYYPQVARVEVVNPGVEVDVISSSLTDKVSQRFELITVGRLVKRKGVDMTLQAIAHLKPLIPKLHYTIIGTGPDRQYIEDIIRELRIESSVTLVTNASDSEKALYLSQADIFVMPTRNINGDYEGFGIVYLEAGVYKKPVIAGRSGGIGDAVSDNVNGLLVNGEDYTEIAEAIIRLYNDEALRIRLGNAGYERSLESTWQKRVTAIYTLLTHYGKIS